MGRLKNVLIDDSEESTKFFYRMETIKQENKKIQCLLNDRGEKVTHGEGIKQIAHNFYQDLWNQDIQQSTEECKEYLSSIPPITTSTEETTTPFISEEEIKIAIQTLNNNKSPGTDGLTTLIPTLQEIYNNSNIRRELTETHNMAIIKLIPKKGNREIKNWKPISLLNTDYKILSIILKIRLIPHIQKHIQYFQTSNVDSREETYGKFISTFRQQLNNPRITIQNWQ